MTPADRENHGNISRIFHPLHSDRNNRRKLSVDLGLTLATHQARGAKGHQLNEILRLLHPYLVHPRYLLSWVEYNYPFVLVLISAIFKVVHWPLVTLTFIIDFPIQLNLGTRIRGIISLSS